MQRLRQRHDHRRASATRGTDARPVTRVLGTLLAAAATLAIAFPTGGSAAQSAIQTVDVTSQSSVFVDTFAVSLPNDPNRCATNIFVEFPDIQGAVSYSARINNRAFSPPREQTFGATPPNFPDDEYTVSLGPFSKILVAPAGRHRLFISGGSSGSGCTPDSWIDLLSMTATVDDTNEPPVASFTWEARDDEPLTVDFNASASTDDDAIQSYDWDFGDGKTGSGITPSHTFATAGTRVVRLTVTDTDGATDSQEQSVTVPSGGGEPPEEPPVAAVTATVSQSDPYTFLLDGSGSTDDGQIVSYEWDFDDGNSGSGATATHTFPGHGTYDVSLTVTDDAALEDTTVKPVLANAPPQVRVAWSPSATNPLTVDVDASQSTDDSEIVSYEWTFGDGTSGSGQTTTHEYAASGAYSATLIVTDDDGTQVEIGFATFVTGGGAYRLELPPVYGEESDLLLDEDGKVVAVECSLGSVISMVTTSVSASIGAGINPACFEGALGLALDAGVGDLPKVLAKLADSFGAAQVFPPSDTDKSFSQMVKAFGVENLSKAIGSLQGRVDTVPLPPAQDGIVSVTPTKKTANSLNQMMTDLADSYQRMNQGLSTIQTWAQTVEKVTPEMESTDGAYRLELPPVYGEESDLLLDEDGKVVAVECSLGSVISMVTTSVSASIGAGINPACFEGALGLALDAGVGDLPKVLAKLADSFGAAQVFPPSGTDKSFSQMVKAFGVENLSKAIGSLQGRVDTVPLPPAQDGIVSVTPTKKTANSLNQMMTDLADSYQRMNQGLSTIQTWAQTVEKVTPETP